MTMRFISKILPLMFIIFCLLGIATVRAELIRISIPQRVEISKSQITLGEIAQIEGVDGIELAKLKAIDLGQAPFPGYERELPKELISLSLQEKGYLLSAFIFDIPNKISIETASQRLSQESLISFAEDYLKKHLAFPADKIRIKSKFCPPDLLIPATDYNLEVSSQVQNNNLLGKISLPVQIKIDDHIWNTVYLGFEVKVKEEVYIAKRKINRGEKLKKDDFKLETRELSNFRGDLIKDLNHSLVKDGIFNIQLAKDEVLTSYYLQKPIIISWGDEVEAEVLVGNVRVSMMVKVRQSGRKGDYILVENPKSGYKFKAEIINSHLVRVIRS